MNQLATHKFLAQRSGAETLASSRGLTFGGAAASLALILLIAQIGVTKLLVAWSLGFAAVALPMWLAIALSYDIWLALKLDFTDLNELRWLPQIQACWFYLAGFISFLSIACLVYSLDQIVGHIFIATSAIGLVFVATAVFAAAHRVRHHMQHPSGVKSRADAATVIQRAENL
jgi:hypothetical protein